MPSSTAAARGSTPGWSASTPVTACSVPAARPCAHHAIARWLDDAPDWAAEFDADVDDLLRLVETIAAAG